ncbi:hypothetical protein AUK40_00450 [Candidatus Wirthbacteria bacterium CG2_30_54_11]|uniref:SHSP domain-containing protein n=1 Tax=Candidatus Wirthbacteria bacterium CG2_30_54_11 TaxID=1817892 RepID=A0A1J5J8D6_9BACT|nr:MAG: hypothetical protein AUK40_00450 [Candidatus Wirthbacteria bacterium CG2_30_54_11]
MTKTTITIKKRTAPLPLRVAGRAVYRLTSPWHQFLPLTDGKWRPNTDIVETPEALVIRMELAGVSRRDISIMVQSDHLVLSGKRKDALQEEACRFIQLEMSYHEFERIIALPAHTDQEHISAELEDGILLIKVPKTTTPDKTNIIKVKIK